MKELVHQRTENSKTYDLGSKRQWRGAMGAVHYKDNYANEIEPWKDIDLTWEGNRITKAPYELTLEGNKITVKDKKTGNISTVKLLEIGGKAVANPVFSFSKGLARCENIAEDTDLEVVAGRSRVRFARILKSDKAPLEAKFKVTGDIPLRTLARDEEDALPVTATLKNGILTEKLMPASRAIKGNIRIDPSVEVRVEADTDDCTRRYNASYFSHADQQLRVGYVNVGAQDGGAAVRFLNVTIPGGATITSAILQLSCKVNEAEVIVSTRLRCEAADNSVTFDDLADFDARAWTTAYTYWDGIGAWTENTVYDSANFASSVKEVIDRGGWSSGNALTVLWDDWEERSDQGDNHRRTGHSHDDDDARAALLVVTYLVITPVTDGDLIGIPVIRRS